jgi:Poly-gamma-glutamate hydrolase
MAKTIIMMFMRTSVVFFPVHCGTRFTNIHESSEYYRRQGCDCGRLSAWQRRKVLKVTMADRYKNFLELATKETQGIDFRARLQQRAGKVVVLAPHGGSIEPGALSKEKTHQHSCRKGPTPLHPSVATRSNAGWVAYR